MSDQMDQAKSVDRLEHEEVKLPVESMIVEAPTAEAALAKAATLWNVRESDLVSEVLEDTKRLFGLLGKKVKARISTKAPLMHLQARNFADEVMRDAELELKATIGEDLTINLEGDDSAIIIGKHGETLKALEFLANLIYRIDQGLPKIRFDCGGYRMRREASLVRLARSVAREVAGKRTSISLEPMSSWERRIIHMALQSNRSITTTSEGEEPMRKIVVRPTGHSDRRRNFRRRRDGRDNRSNRR